MSWEDTLEDFTNLPSDIIPLMLEYAFGCTKMHTFHSVFIRDDGIYSCIECAIDLQFEPMKKEIDEMRLDISSLEKFFRPQR